MGRIAAMGGNENELLFRYILGRSDKEKPNFLFVATASSDKTDYYASIAGRVRPYVRDTRPLYLFRRKYTEAQLDALFDWADAVYVCGGDTFLMMEKWRQTGVDRRLRDYFDRDRGILCGSSAGGICWFRRGLSDSSRTPEYPPHGWVDGLGIFPDKTFCPHFSSRREAFEQALRDSGEEGFGMANDTVYLFENGEASFARLDDGCEIAVYENRGGVLSAAAPAAVNLTALYS